MSKRIFGTVHFRDPMKVAGKGEDFLAVRGSLKVGSMRALLGVESGETQAPWCVVVTGKKGSITVLGDQVRAISAHAKDAPAGHHVYVV